jgi:hypothetical protein
MTTKIGLSGSEATVPDPIISEPYEIGSGFIGASVRTVNGTLKTHRAARKQTWRVIWRTTSPDTITDELDRLSDLSWQPPEGGSYTVALQGNYRKMPLNASLYQIEAMLEEV